MELLHTAKKRLQKVYKSFIQQPLAPPLAVCMSIQPNMHETITRTLHDRRNTWLAKHLLKAGPCFTQAMHFPSALDRDIMSA